jgi:acetyl esterase/lipase
MHRAKATVFIRNAPTRALRRPGPGSYAGARMKKLFALAALLAWISPVLGQPTNSFLLWPDGAPGALGKEEKDIPTLTPYFPEQAVATGAAMVICPGGAYVRVTVHEGEHYARFLAENGIAGMVLKYRLGSDGYRHPVMLQDAARAVRLVRARAQEWKLDPKRIGIMGSSAGGHLAATLLTHFDAGNPDATDPIERQGCRPDLGILCYPVITMGQYTHELSRNMLLGKAPSPELVRELSNELQVTKNTPPCFLWHTYEDTAVPVENTLLFAEALRKAGVPFDLHIYQKGSHGLGLGSQDYAPEKRLPWTQDCIYWLKVQGFAASGDKDARPTNRSGP